MLAGASTNYLRARSPHEHNKVSFTELFFDLVFVFAITQLSHFLLKHLTLMGAVQTGILFLAVWWVWIFTSWVTNWVDPERTPVRLMMYGLMLAGLVLSTSIPEAFEGRGLSFALAYVSMQVGRSLFMIWALKQHDWDNFRNFQRITAWLATSALFWLAGGLAEHDLRLWLWLIALAIEYVSPSLGFRTPGLGRSATTDWLVEGGHLAERCGLFVIIALGESILVTGATFSELDGHRLSCRPRSSALSAVSPCGGSTSTQGRNAPPIASRIQAIRAGSRGWHTHISTLSSLRAS